MSGQATADEVISALLADRDRMLTEIAGLRTQVADLRRAIELGRELVATMEGQG